MPDTGNGGREMGMVSVLRKLPVCAHSGGTDLSSGKKEEAFEHLFLPHPGL